MDHPIRILMLNNEFPPLGGGTGVVNKQLFDQFSAYPEFEFHLITSSMEFGRNETSRFSDNIFIHKISCPSSNIHHSSAQELLIYTFNALRAAVRLHKQIRFDLSFAFSSVPAGAVSYWLYYRNNLPFVVSLQGPDIPGFEIRYRRLYPFLKPLLRKIWRSAHTCLAISEQQLALAQAFFTGANFKVIPNGVSARYFVERHGRSAGPIRIICVGRLIERKGQEYLIRAVKTLASQQEFALELQLVGTGDDQERLRTMAAELGLMDLVHFVGVVSQEEMPELYQQADIFVLPSEHEGMSIALIEAMASGLPVIVTNTGGTKELVVEGENGAIVPFANVTALAEAITRIIRALETGAKLGERSRTIATNFKWPEIAGSYLDLFKQVRTSHPSTRRWI